MYQSVANQFGCGRSAVGGILMQISCTIVKVLSNWVMKLGNAQEIIDGLAHMKFPNYIMAIDGSRVPSFRFPSH